MKIRIDVKDKAEGAAIRAALADPVTRATMVVTGTLLPHTQRTRRRVLEFIVDKLDEDKRKRFANAAKESWT